MVHGVGDQACYVASGAIKMAKKMSRYEKLAHIFNQIGVIIDTHAPTHFAIEDIFYSKNPRSAIVLGEARGAAILAASMRELPIFEYPPREVKLSVTGNGAAHKSQVNFMLGKILRLPDPPSNADESDALAIAMCHAFKHREWSRV